MPLKWYGFNDRHKLNMGLMKHKLKWVAFLSILCI